MVGESFLFSEIVGLGSVALPAWLSFGLACLLDCGRPHVVNLIDGLDGLASGIVLSGLLAISVIGYLVGVPDLLGFYAFDRLPALAFGSLQAVARLPFFLETVGALP